MVVDLSTSILKSEVPMNDKENIWVQKFKLQQSRDVEDVIFES